MCSRTIIPDLINKNRKILISDLEKAKAFAVHFANIFTKDRRNCKMPSFDNRSGTNLIDTISFSLDKIKKASRFVNKSDAAGPGNISGIFTTVYVIVCLFL